MRTKGSPDELEHRRLLAVQRVLEGYSAEEVAEFLGVDPRSVWRWLAAFRDRGPDGPGGPPRPGPAAQAHPHPGEDHPPVAGRQADRARVPDRAVDRPAAGPHDPTRSSASGSTRSTSPLAAGPRLHPAEAPAGPSRARPGGDRRVAWPPTGRASKKGPAAGRPHRPDRRERPADGPAGPPHLGAPGPDARTSSRARRPPREGLRRGGRCGSRRAATGWGCTSRPWSTATSTTGT